MDAFIAFTTAFAVVALAELGDKTQILAIVLASRYRRLPVLLGLMAALSLLSLVAVLCGAVIFRYIPPVYVRFAAGVAFIAFAAWTFLEKEGEEGEEEEGKKCGRKQSVRVFAYCFTIVAVAEFGDKTQLSTIVLASGFDAPVFIFLGAVLAFFVVDAPCVYVGKKLSEKVNLRYIKMASGVLFLALGVFFILEALGILRL